MSKRTTIHEHMDLISDALHGNPKAQAIWDAVPDIEKATLSWGDTWALVEAVVAQAWGLSPAPKGWKPPKKGRIRF